MLKLSEPRNDSLFLWILNDHRYSDHWYLILLIADNKLPVLYSVTVQQWRILSAWEEANRTHEACELLFNGWRDWRCCWQLKCWRRQSLVNSTSAHQVFSPVAPHSADQSVATFHMISFHGLAWCLVVQWLTMRWRHLTTPTQHRCTTWCGYVCASVHVVNTAYHSGQFVRLSWQPPAWKRGKVKENVLLPVVCYDM